MPQDIPVEASETLAFTPPSIAKIEGAPRFTLRAATLREERYLAMLKDEDGLVTYSEAQVRGEARRGLAALWSQEDRDTHLPRIEAYWESLDDFVLQAREDPDLVWDFDADEIVRINEILREVETSHKPLARMKAQIKDNRIYGRVYLVAVILKDWTGLDVSRRVKDGYVTVDCVTAIARKLFEFEQKHQKEHGLDPGSAFEELHDACARRFRLDEEEAKNSELPSPSSESREPSTEATSAKAGKSQASARSSKTRATA